MKDLENTGMNIARRSTKMVTARFIATSPLSGTIATKIHRLLKISGVDMIIGLPVPERVNALVPQWPNNYVMAKSLPVELRVNRVIIRSTNNDGGQKSGWIEYEFDKK